MPESTDKLKQVDVSKLLLLTIDSFVTDYCSCHLTRKAMHCSSKIDVAAREGDELVSGVALFAIVALRHLTFHKVV